MAFERTVTSRGHKYRQLVESRWDPIKKQSRIHVIKQIGKVVEENGEEKVIPAALRVDSIQRAYPDTSSRYLDPRFNCNYLLKDNRFRILYLITILGFTSPC